MINETVFDPPHFATEEEYRKIRNGEGKTFEELILREKSLDNDRRWTTIYDLYSLRKNKEWMEKALLKIEDKEWRKELGYNDLIERPGLS